MGSNKKDSLGDRMKNYEGVPKTRLTRRTPVIIRIDGKAFHTFTRGFNKPFDKVLSNAMVRTMEHLCRNIQGCVFGYTQSDEITLVLVDYRTLNTCAWFDYEVQKMCSISASMATAAFKDFFLDEVKILNGDLWVDKNGTLGKYGMDTVTMPKVLAKYEERIGMHAMFDSRCFNIPKEEVANCLVWRQQDATRNSIEMVGRAHFSDKELFKKNCSDIQDMLMEHFGINWNDTETRFKRGVCCYKRPVEGKENGRNEWFVDFEIPIFTQDRDYIEKHIIINQ